MSEIGNGGRPSSGPRSGKPRALISPRAAMPAPASTPSRSAEQLPAVNASRQATPAFPSSAIAISRTPHPAPRETSGTALLVRGRQSGATRHPSLSVRSTSPSDPPPLRRMIAASASPEAKFSFTCREKPKVTSITALAGSDARIALIAAERRVPIA